jgi:hypothetical protein
MNATIQNIKGQRIAKVSIVAYVLLCALLLFTLKCDGTEEMENMGIMVNLGTVDEGMFENNIPTSPDNETVEEASEEASSSEAELESNTQDLVPTNVNASPKPSNPSTKPTNNTSNTTQTPTNNTSPSKATANGE